MLRNAAVLTLFLPFLAQAQGGFSGAGTYEITNVKSGKVLDLDRNDQTTVIQFSARQTDNQMWDISQADGGYWFLRNRMNGYALDAPSNRNSEPVRGVPFNGGPSQQWRFDPGKDGNILIVNRQGRALDIPDGTDRDGARVQIYNPNGDSNQRFMLRQVAAGRGGGFRRGGRLESARGPYGSAQPARIVCSSNSGNRVRCEADTRNGVQMVRQISGTACRQGETWGYDANSVWVDRGCRAEFELGGSGYQSGGRYSSTVTCESSSGGRVRCDADTSRGVRLFRQLGGNCSEGSTWGWDRRGIWVDRGCRAEFELQR